MSSRERDLEKKSGHVSAKPGASACSADLYFCDKHRQALNTIGRECKIASATRID
jgi:hypothetical protein